MNKILTYLKYFYEYLKFGDFLSIFAAVKYLLFKKSHQSDRIIKTSLGSFFCRKNTNDFQFANYNYEWSVKKYILDNLNGTSVFIDGGACIGEYSVMLSQHNVRCIAFEPIMNNYNSLLKNLELNNLAGKVKTFPFGLGDKSMKASYVFNPVNTGASYIDIHDHSSVHKTDIRTFDSFINELDISKEDHILFKLDVEGMETEALRGARKFISQYPNITFVMEDKHTGKESIKNALMDMADFEFEVVDGFNISAKKIR